MAENGKFIESSTVQIADLSPDKTNDFHYRVPWKDHRQLAQEVGVLRVNLLRLRGRIVQQRNGDWSLDARLQARVVQQCITTLQHLKTRIDSAVQRTYVTDKARMACRADNRIPEDDSLEPLGPTIDLFTLAREALILELPLYPHSPTATARFSGTEIDGRGAEEKPFAGLADFYRLLKEGDQGPNSS